MYAAQVRYPEAEADYKRALAIRERHLGADHAATAEIHLGLAALYRVKGRYADADSLYRNALSIYESKRGQDHTAVAHALYGLALTAQIKGNLIEFPFAFVHLDA